MNGIGPCARLFEASQKEPTHIPGKILRPAGVVHRSRGASAGSRVRMKKTPPRVATDRGSANRANFERALRDEASYFPGTHGYDALSLRDTGKIFLGL